MVRIGIIGTGGMAEYQAKKFSAVEGCVLSACKDHKENHAEDFARRFSIPAWYSSLDTLLGEDDCDALSCVVVDSRHRAHCEKVLMKGLPLLCEKPLARSVADCEFLAALAAERAAPNLVNFSKRNSPALSALKAAVRSGTAGRLLSVEASYLQGWVATGEWGDWMTVPRWKWRLLPEFSTAGAVGDLGTHLVDAILYAVGPLAPEAAGTESPRVTTLSGAMDAGRVARRRLPPEFGTGGSGDGSVPVEFSASGRLRDDQGGAAVEIRASWIDSGAKDDFRIILRGEKGTLELDLRRSRDAAFFRPAGGGPERTIPGAKEPSTYERFVRAARTHMDRGAGEAGAAGYRAAPDDPTFQRALDVQRTLDRLLPGILPA